jgi:methylglutaconyl-CoA hydratase
MNALPHFPLLRLIYQGETLRLEVLAHSVLRLVLARPRVRNAINVPMIEEFEQLFARLEGDPIAGEARLLLLQGEGDCFCAGADLAYMRSQAEASEEDNLEDARRLGRLFRRIAAFPVPVVCYVQGAAIGGGLGLAVCSEFVLAQSEAIFATPEVRLGLVPGVIGPYVVRKLGFAHAAPLMLAGLRLTGREGLHSGLVQRVVEPAEKAEEALDQVLLSFLQAGPYASRRTLGWLRRLNPLPDPEVIEASARVIAEVRKSKEGQAGIEAHIAKALPPWGIP